MGKQVLRINGYFLAVVELLIYDLRNGGKARHRDKAMRSLGATWFAQLFGLLLGLFLSAIVAAEPKMGEERLKNENTYEQETRQRPSEIEPKAIVYVYRNREIGEEPATEGGKGLWQRI